MSIRRSLKNKIAKILESEVTPVVNSTQYAYAIFGQRHNSKQSREYTEFFAVALQEPSTDKLKEIAPRFRYYRDDGIILPRCPPSLNDFDVCSYTASDGQACGYGVMKLPLVPGSSGSKAAVIKYQNSRMPEEYCAIVTYDNDVTGATAMRDYLVNKYRGAVTDFQPSDFIVTIWFEPDPPPSPGHTKMSGSVVFYVNDELPVVS